MVTLNIPVLNIALGFLKYGTSNFRIGGFASESAYAKPFTTVRTLVC
jgi:hypothetical protein